MKINELASEYLTAYDDTDVIITAVNQFDFDNNAFVVVFDLSDGTHWYSDHNDSCQVAESLVDCEIVCHDDGWDQQFKIQNDDGSLRSIPWEG